MIANKIKTCLWFDNNAQQAAEMYTRIIPNSEITAQIGSAANGQPLAVEFNLAGVPYQAINGGPHFTLSEAASIAIRTQGQEETDAYWAALTADGGKESRCGWLVDKFGLSWQVVPVELIDMLRTGSAEAVTRMQQALFPMHKIDIAELQKAFAGENQ